MSIYHSHLKVLSHSDCLRLLQDASFGHLGFHWKGKMVILPTNIHFQDGFIYSHSLEGSKLEGMRKNPAVCVQTEVIEGMTHWKSVLAWGQFQECSDEEATRIMRSLIGKMNLTHRKMGGSTLEVDFTALLERSVVYRIKIEDVAGRWEADEE